MSDFQIGSTELGMVTLNSLGVNTPQNDPVYFSQSVDRADALVSGVGWSTDVWMWAGISIAQRNIMKTYCTGKSSSVYIRTMLSDQIYATFRAVMIWQEKETQKSDFVFDLQIQFRLLEEIA